jgi:hypothetical protein
MGDAASTNAGMIDDGAAAADASTTTVASVVANALDVDIGEVIKHLLAFGQRVGEHVNSRELDGVIDDQRALARLQREDPDDTDPPPHIASTCGALNTIQNANRGGGGGAGGGRGCGGRMTDEWRFAALREIESRGRMSRAFAEALGTNCTVGRAFAAAEANAKLLVWRLIGCDLIKFRSPADARDAINAAAAAARASLLRASLSSSTPLSSALPSPSSSSSSSSSSSLSSSSLWTFDYPPTSSCGRCGVGDDNDDNDDDDDDPTPPLFIDSDGDDDEKMEK